MLAPSLTLTNEGDGVDGHPVPVPQICIYLTFVAGRGGMLDYMTYNTRIASVLVEMAENLGWDADELAHAKTMRHDSWIYIAQFFGPRAEPLPNPNDSINADPCL